MHYLFGDSTPSRLTTNFLEFLKSAIEFCVTALHTDERIRQGQAKAVRLAAEAEAEIERLEAFIHVVTTAIDEAPTGAAKSPTSECAKRLRAATNDAHRGTANAVRQRLATENAAIDEAEAAAREPCVRALEALLVHQDVPDAASATRVVLAEDGSRYTATLASQAAFGLEWLIDLAIPDANLWASPIQLSRIHQQMELRVPQVTGWISKEVKTKPMRVERQVVTELADDRGVVGVKLRELGGPTGFDLQFAFDGEPRVLSAERLGPTEDAAAGPFTPAPEDVALLLDLASKLRGTTSEFTKRALVAARTGGSEFRAQPFFIDFVKRLLDMMTPITRELAERSLTPNELIMRRPLTNDRREEIFVAKATLREKYDVLPPHERALFLPLGLEGATPASLTPAPHRAHTSVTPPPVQGAPRSVPPRSVPPPLPSSVPPPEDIPVDLVEDKSPTMKLGPLPPAKPPPRRMPPPPPSTPAVPPPPNLPSDLSASPASRALDAILSTPPPKPVTASAAPPPVIPRAPPPVVSRPPSAAAPPLPSKPPSAFPPPLPDGQQRNPELVAELKRLHALNRDGQTDEAFVGYQNMMADRSFEAYRIDEQRMALRLMVMAKTKSPPSEAIQRARRAAVERLEFLTETFEDPADYELLGVALVGLEELEAARRAYTTALALARQRDPQSELVGTLMRRVSEI